MNQCPRIVRASAYHRGVGIYQFYCQGSEYHPLKSFERMNEGEGWDIEVRLNDENCQGAKGPVGSSRSEKARNNRMVRKRDIAEAPAVHG